MKVSIDREELVKLREHVHTLVTERGDFREQAWLGAMSMLNAMIGKGSGESLCDTCSHGANCAAIRRVTAACDQYVLQVAESVCKGCYFDGGDCYSQKKLGGWVNSCAMRVPATPPAPKVDYSDGSALGPRGHTDPGDENLLVDGRLPPQYVTWQEMEAAIADALKAHEKKKHVVAEGVTSRDGYQVMMRPIAQAAAADAMKAHEAEGHGMKPLSALVCEDCAHVDVCAMRNNQNPQNCGHVLRTTPQS